MNRVEVEIGGRILRLETGRMAKQADGAVYATYADTGVLVAVVAAKKTNEDQDFFPLTVDYRERHYAAGRFPGGFIKREGRPSDSEILSARLIDRPIRPLFPESFFCETQVMCTVLSSDKENDAGILCIVAASAALGVSDIPFNNLIAGVKVGRIDGKLIVNPTYTEQLKSDIELVVAGTKDAIIMVEGGSKEITETELLDALKFAHENIKKIVAVQEELVAQCGKKKREVKPVELDTEVNKQVREYATAKISDAVRIAEKEAREEKLNAVRDETQEHFKEILPEKTKEINTVFNAIEYETVRKMILDESKRADGRGLTDIRPITCELGILARTHGSALFTRGQTQALAVTTLGTSSDEQIIDNILGESSKRFMLHYNFPPYSVGEVRRISGPGRREIGHGNLAERALLAVIPSVEAFPYTIRVVSDILESNGSSSMASVCGGSLAMMDAGVPITSPVAGIAMGLVKEGDKIAVISDIMGLEDHLGDMDFKVAGTEKGITAFQLDLKVTGISFEIMEKALQQARAGRFHILGEMAKTITTARTEMSPYAPRLTVMQINPEKIREVIGPGGKVINKIIDETGVKIDIEQDGRVIIASTNGEASAQAIEMIKVLTEDVEVGKIYNGTVTRLMNFGAFVEILPGKEGLVHISQLDEKRVAKVEDVVKEGDKLFVKVVEIDDMHRVNLSRKQAIREMAGLPAVDPNEPKYERPERSGGRDRDRDRGGRDRDRHRR